MTAQIQNEEQKGFQYLLFFLLLYIFGTPFLAPFQTMAFLAHVSLSVVLFLSIYTIRRHRRQRVVAIAIFIPLLLLYWLGIYDIVPFTRLGSYFLFVVYFGLLVWVYITQLGRFPRISSNVLYAVLCLYLIVGLFWGALYALVNELSPGSYNGILLENAQGGKLDIFNYFSLVTLTTLGYGDITPQTRGAASLCQLEAIIGQFFTAVVVAWVVGSIVAEKQKNEG